MVFIVNNIWFRPMKTKSSLHFILLIALSLIAPRGTGGAAESGPSDWEKTLKSAEAEGEVTVYVVDYPRFTVNQFHKAFPKIRLNQVDGPSGPALSSRLMAERRAGKYQADVYVAGQGTHVSVLYPAKALAPMPPALILPEVKDESKWFKGKHRFVDPEARHSFVFQGHRGLYISVNTQQAKADEIKSWRDLLISKWKGKIIGYDPTIAGVARNTLWYFYMNNALGAEFITKLYGDMQLTLSRDHRQLVDWLAAGKGVVCVPCDDAELASGKEQRLPSVKSDEAVFPQRWHGQQDDCRQDSYVGDSAQKRGAGKWGNLRSAGLNVCCNRASASRTKRAYLRHGGGAVGAIHADIESYRPLQFAPNTQFSVKDLRLLSAFPPPLCLPSLRPTIECFHDP